MTGLITIIVLGALLGAWCTIAAGRKSLANTTLLLAWNWLALAGAAWTTAYVCDHCLHLVSEPFADHLWYAASVFALCPAIAVLGARRPGNRVWTTFILLPMLLALGWPMGTLAIQGSELRGLQLETPQLTAYVLVLIMGFGNYCGTRNTLPAVIFSLALFGTVLSISSVSPTWLENRNLVRLWCTGGVAIMICSMAMRRKIVHSEPFDRVWFDFFDDFGIVWGRRIQDRINHLAQREGLPIRLELDGFQFQDSTSDQIDQSNRARSPQTEARIEHFLRWLLRRFVDPIWIDERLGHSAKDVELQRITVDS